MTVGSGLEPDDKSHPPLQLSAPSWTPWTKPSPVPTAAFGSEANKDQAVSIKTGLRTAQMASGHLASEGGV